MSVSNGYSVRYQGRYNSYKGTKVSKVGMCEVRSGEKTSKNKPKKKKGSVGSSKNKWTVMNPI